MKSHLMYTLITICVFVGIGAVIKGLSKNSGQGARDWRSSKFNGAATVTTGILLIAAGLLLLYIFNDLLTE